MLPLGDQNEPGRGWAVVTLAFMAINVAVFVLLQLPSDAFTYGYSAVPAEITSGRDLVGRVRGIPGLVLEPSPQPVHLTLLSSMFMHGGWLHLGGNMLFLYIFGDNVEHRLGPIRFAVFYLAAGLAGSLAQIAIDPDSVIPTLGASGAISGVLGAYIVLFPQNRVTVLMFRFLVAVPAIVAIGIWAALQFVNGAGQIAQTEETGGVAYMAHIGGFLAGVAVGFLARSMGSGPQRRGRSAG